MEVARLTFEENLSWWNFKSPLNSLVTHLHIYQFNTALNIFFNRIPSYILSLMYALSFLVSTPFGEEKKTSYNNQIICMLARNMH